MNDDSTASNCTPRAKAPPKSAPPTAGEEKSADGGAKKKKALPPPSNPPPSGGTASAAAAFRAKSSGLPPPSGPPPTGAAPSASVAKIRGTARPPSAGPPPSGAALAKPVGAPPSTKPPAKPMGAPPSSAPPGASAPAKAEAKAVDALAECAAAVSADAKTATGAQPVVAKEKPEAKRAPQSSMYTAGVGEAKTPRPGTAGGGAKVAAPVDILGNVSPILSPHSAAAALAPEPSTPASAKTPKQAPPKTAPPPYASRPQSSAPIAAAPLDPAIAKPTVAKKSTMEVLNDTTATLSQYSRNIDEHLAKSVAPHSTDHSESSGTAGGLGPSAAGASNKLGRAVPFSGSSRPNVPEEEVITVRKQETKKSDVDESGGASESKQLAPGASEAKSSASKAVAPQCHFDDALDDIEEIPFLEEPKPNPKLVAKSEAKRTVAHEDDPVIEIENKHAAPKTSSYRALPAQGEAKESNNNHADDKTHRSTDDEEEDARLLSTGRESHGREDVYDELRKLKFSSPPPDESDQDSALSSEPHQYPNQPRSDSAGDDAKESAGGRERAREKRKEKRRNRLDDEPKKIQPQFFNPKSVPYVPDHLLEFAKRPLECGRGHIVKCFIERNDSGPNKLSPIYTLLLEVNSSSGRPVMYARKKAASRITSHYVISMNKDDLFLSRTMRSHQYIGKLRSSTSMLDYCLYDQGDNPEDLDSDCEVDDELRKSIRAELAVIRYHNTKKSYARKMEVVIPSIVDNGSGYLDWRPISRDQMMEEHVRAITAAGGQNVLDTSNFVFLHKRETKYDPLSSCIVDFRSRATCVSVKNFQLVHSEPANEQMREKYRKLHPEYVYEDQGTVSLPQEHVLLQLGKVGKDCFNMDFQYPLSMLQAFAISLSRFDTKQR
ncbi:hypothetical protein PybrP1_004249 [[Pythium] brassicae (nom. inval.)]|nr:hypothetical protein PybrP1_004249 [[Pythium] brassicae (nom. inval.)]